MNVFVLAPSMN